MESKALASLAASKCFFVNLTIEKNLLKLPTKVLFICHLRLLCCLVATQKIKYSLESLINYKIHKLFEPIADTH